MIWSRTTRLIHWLIALPVFLNFVLEGGELPHKILGYVALAGVLFRFGWGLRATDYAHFKKFPLSYLEVRQYVGDLFERDKKSSFEGHNPLASWTYLFIWILIIALGISGWMMGLDAYWGEEWLEELHETFSNSLMALVGLHLLGIAFDSWKYRRRTWLGMITGKKS